MNGQIDGHKGEQMISGCMDKWVDEQIEEWMNGHDGWKDRRPSVMNGWTDGRREGPL